MMTIPKTNIDMVMQVQLKMYEAALQKMMPQRPATIALFLLIFPFFLEKDYFSNEELREKVIAKTGYYISQEGFRKHIVALFQYGLLSRKHYRAFGLNLQRIQSMNEEAR